MEMCDVLDASGKYVGKKVVRGTKLQQGEYYLVVQVWIRNEAGEYLVQQRSPDLASDPGIWSTTAGYVQAGEESSFGAIREVNEELGIQLSLAQLRRFDRLKMENRIEDIWFAEVQKNSLGTPMLSSEVADWKWASKHEIRQMISRSDFFAYSYFDQIPD